MSATKIIAQKTATTKTFVHPANIGTDPNFERRIVWFNVGGFLLLHLGAIYGLYCIFFEIKYQTNIWWYTYGWFGGIGITAGAHRYFTHRSFSASWLLRLILIIGQTIAGQNCVYIWARDHRQHHKFSDTDADPHNANRGFFFSHMGWLMSKKHPLVIAKGKSIDLSDLEADPLVMFQKKYYNILYFIFAFWIPVFVPIYFWNENWINSLFVCYFFRYAFSLHSTWLVNSVAHIYGMKPYDKSIRATENQFVATMAYGEGWHNYHHTFPWDYRAAELGQRYSITTFFIDTMAKLGLAYNFKAAPFNCIKNVAIKRGDGSHPIYGQGHADPAIYSTFK